MPSSRAEEEKDEKGEDDEDDERGDVGGEPTVGAAANVGVRDFCCCCCCCCGPVRDELISMLEA